MRARPADDRGTLRPLIASACGMSSCVPWRKSRGLRVAILGAGLMGYWHGRTAGHLGAKLVAIVDPDMARANALARRLRVGRTAEDASDLLRGGQLDAVHICSPRPTHFDLARCAVESGVHALVEKPLSDSAEEAEMLVNIARRRAVVLCPVHQIAFQNGVEDTAQVLPGLGRLSAIEIRICSAGGVGRTERELNEIVGDILPHPLSILRRLWPNSVFEPKNWHTRRLGLGEFSVAGLHAEANFSMLISLHARPTRFEMMVSGNRGSLQLDFFHGFAVRHDGRVSRLRKASRPFVAALSLFGAATVNLFERGLAGELAYPGLRQLTKRFYAAVRGEMPPPISAADIIAVAAARDALLIRGNPRVQAFHGKAFLAEQASPQ
jgi:predicted dehydrogenase